MKKVNLFVCFLLFCAVTTSPATAAISDHVFYIWVDQGLDYEDPTDNNDLTYDFCIEMDTDDTVSLVQFLTPAGHTFEIPDLVDNWDANTRTWTTHDYDDEDDVWWWEYSRDCPELSGLQVFGDGWYTITVYYEGGGQDQTDVWFGIPGTQDHIPQPTQKPVFISPPHHGSVNSPVTFTWQQCTDPAATGIWIELEEKETYEGPENEFDRTETTWGPVPLIDGFWEAEICFEQWYWIPANDDGIEYEVGKYSESDYEFAVGRPWVAYEVWAGDTDYTAEPEWWRYYENINQQDYVKLGESSGPTATFSGDYNFYVIAVRQEVLIDSIRGSDGLYYQNGLSTGNTSDWQNILGAPDDQYATVGYHESGGTFRGFVVITNPGNWIGITVITDQAAAPALPDSYEPDDTSSQANWLGTLQTHNIAPAGDVDWLKFLLVRESEVVIETSGATGNTQMWLYDSSISEIEYNNDGGAGSFSRIDCLCGLDALPAGTYYVAIDEYGNDDEIPSYDITLTVTPCEAIELCDPLPIFRFWSPTNQRHFYTIGEPERNKLFDKYPQVWTYESIAYYAFQADCGPGLVPVYRFWSPVLEAHFYTISESEKQKLIDRYPHVWTYEYVAYYAYAPGQQPAGACPVYRFWSPVLETHFYTTSETERDKLINKYPHVWTYEGVAWYVLCP